LEAKVAALEAKVLELEAKLQEKAETAAPAGATLGEGAFEEVYKYIYKRQRSRNPHPKF
jgi:hypothetical protein